jgi:hypothetical protein
MTSEAVITAMPMTEIAVILLMTFFLLLEERYLRAI